MGKGDKAKTGIKYHTMGIYYLKNRSNFGPGYENIIKSNIWFIDFCYYFYRAFDNPYFHNSYEYYPRHTI
jgi:hypothetical protein